MKNLKLIFVFTSAVVLLFSCNQLNEKDDISKPITNDLNNDLLLSNYEEQLSTFLDKKNLTENESKKYIKKYNDFRSNRTKAQDSLAGLVKKKSLVQILGSEEFWFESDLPELAIGCIGCPVFYEVDLIQTNFGYGLDPNVNGGVGRMTFYSENGSNVLGSTEVFQFNVIGDFPYFDAILIDSFSPWHDGIYYVCHHYDDVFTNFISHHGIFNHCSGIWTRV